MQDLKYPIGKFYYDPTFDKSSMADWIQNIKKFPTNVEEVLAKTTPIQIDTPYRPLGWTGRQVVHHVADSHSHALLRFKCALTEHHPTIKPYLEDKYAELIDYILPLDSALMILRGVHIKWINIINAMTNDDWEKGYFHPESGKFFTLHHALALYSWHCRHHLGHLLICSKK